MVSAAEQLSASLTLSNFSRATELKARIWFTLGALIIYRLGTYIPVPGLDASVLKGVFDNYSSSILGVFDAFAGGALGRMSIFALNIFPYISASIIIQLMTAVSPQLGQLKKDGDYGRTKLIQYTRYLTVILTAIQGYAIAVGLEGMGGSAVHNPGLFFRLTTVITLVGGTVYLMWLGEQITIRGIGNGISLIIFAGIVAHLPMGVSSLLTLGWTGQISSLSVLMFVLLAVAVIVAVVYMERAQRRITIQYPKRQVGQQVYGAQSSHLPLKLNTAGVIPPIFANALLVIPASILQFSGGQSSVSWVNDAVAMLGHGQPLYMLVYASLIVFFCFFYTSIVFNPVEVADNLKKNTAFIPGIRPGKATASYIDSLLTRLTVFGAAYLVVVCLLPEFLMAEYSIPFYFGGTSLLIVVTVVMDTINHINSHLLVHQYDGLMKKNKLVKGR
jgi:preprotein translocase subunit SecY